MYEDSYLVHNSIGNKGCKYLASAPFLLLRETGLSKKAAIKVKTKLAVKEYSIFRKRDGRSFRKYI
jgi:hypothetical protein